MNEGSHLIWENYRDFLTEFGSDDFEKIQSKLNPEGRVLVSYPDGRSSVWTEEVLSRYEDLKNSFGNPDQYICETHNGSKLVYVSDDGELLFSVYESGIESGISGSISEWLRFIGEELLST
ncbi:MAG: hypothetical protein ABEJ56_00490 [Candidatus Nanohaloarchaea archaeon]